MLGLTFTRKAAGELAERVQVRLAQLARARGGAASALSLLDRPTVATYNAYAASLVGDHGLRVGVEPGPACSVRRSSGSSRRRSWSPGTTTWAPTAP